MLFILAMDVLSTMISKAEEQGLSSLAEVGIKHRLSLYADDVVLFGRPRVSEIVVIRSI